MDLRAVESTDLDAILRLNNAAVPAVNTLERADLDWFTSIAHTFIVAADDSETVAAFLIGLGPEAGYDSLNYAWFSERFDDFIYVDRVVVGDTAKGQGIGSRLYDEFAMRGRAQACPRMLAEVNIRPRNDTSLGFHERHGFSSIGEQDTEGGEKRVTLLERPLG